MWAYLISYLVIFSRGKLAYNQISRLKGLQKGKNVIVLVYGNCWVMA